MTGTAAKGRFQRPTSIEQSHDASGH